MRKLEVEQHTFLGNLIRITAGTMDSYSSNGNTSNEGRIS